ncbi:MAG: hypothetical protein JKY86_05245 [Gammaproteobacteria bacterium]|nr:hypothetical protein [Gammaproteobacteria bacterium]
MSKKKARKNSEQGTYALCITTGLIVIGLGLGPLLGMLASSAIGGTIGGVAAYLIINRKSGRKN